jgi:hypothetical protein
MGRGLLVRLMAVQAGSERGRGGSTGYG